MPIRQKSSQDQLQLTSAECMVDGDQRLRQTEQQKALAREMVKQVREMCNRAAEMRKPPRAVMP